MKTLLTTVAAALLLMSAPVQGSAQDFGPDKAGAAGVMAPYRFTPNHDTPAPRGYRPFYISHYGRHGARYHIAAVLRRYIPEEMIAASAAGALTAEGEAALRAMQEVIDLHAGRDGDLSELGDWQHRMLASRMCHRYPAVFPKGAVVKCSSSLLPRCLMSMTAFATGLLGEQPELDISYATGEKVFRLLCHPYVDQPAYHRYLDSLDSVRRPLEFDPTRLVQSFFVPGYALRDSQAVALQLYHLGSIEPCLGRPCKLYGFFTPDELRTQWLLYNDWIYGDMSNSLELSDGIVPAACDLLADIVARADAAVAGAADAASADLRFGHDSGLLPLVSLAGLEGFDTPMHVTGAWKSWEAQERIPVAANLQLVFYRSRRGEVLVKVLYNEEETLIPDLTPVSGPYYSWPALRTYWLGRAKQ